jgi:hypothetical protein
MSLKQSRMNNMKMSFERKSLTYEAIMIDLYLCGGIPKRVAEALIGREIPDYVTLPTEVQEALEAHPEPDDASNDSDSMDHE